MRDQRELDGMRGENVIKCLAEMKKNKSYVKRQVFKGGNNTKL